MDPADLQEYESIAAETLVATGYELSTDAAPPSPVS